MTAIVRALAPPPSITLQVSGVVLNDTFWSSRDNWEAFAATLNEPTQEIAQALWNYSGIGKIQIKDNIVRIKSDCNFHSIEQAVVRALGAYFVEYIPPPPISIRDRLHLR